MKKFFLIFLITLVIISTSIFLYLSITMANRQNHIFCNLLNPGMSKDDVVHVLEQFGNIDYNVATFGDKNFIIYVGYVDPAIVGRKTFLLTFRDGNYTGASVLTGFWKGIDGVDAVCKP